MIMIFLKAYSVLNHFLLFLFSESEAKLVAFQQKVLDVGKKVSNQSSVSIHGCKKTRYSFYFKVWYTIGTEVTKPPPDEVTRGSDAYIPSQPFLTALVHIFPHLFQHIKSR